MGAAISGIDLLRAASVGDSPLPPCAELLGWKLLDIEPGHIRVQYTAGEQFYNPMGSVQGGFLAAMLDDAMGPAAFTLLKEGQFAPTLELHVNFLRPARAGTLIAEGRVVHRTRRVVFMEGTLSAEDGKAIATATATAVINSAAREAEEKENA